MKVVIKVGGTLLDDPASRRSIARQLTEVARQHELAVIHGGGKQMTRYLEERGVQSRFVDGLRVSDEAVIDAATKVIAGSVNKQLVSAIIAEGGAAIGLSGVDGLLARAVQLDPALYFVGKTEKGDGRLLDLLVQAGYVPVVACIAGDERGNIYNVNADQMAAACALGWRAAALIFLTDVEGVRGPDGRKIKHLTPAAISELIDSGTAAGGMRAKLDAANVALAGGIEQVLVASGHERAVCARLLSGEVTGTRISAQAAVEVASL